METHSQKAQELFMQGYNCAQAVVCAYADELNIDEETLKKLASSFGGGMGRLREVCGTVSGIFMIAGLKKGYSKIGDDEIKHQHYELIQELGHKFEEKHGSMICRDLLNLLEKESSPIPDKRTAEYYKIRPCIKFVASACEILDETLN